MQTYRVRHRSGTTLFEGDYRSLREGIETALEDGIRLDGADFSQLDLSEINLDGASLRGADFSFSNLTGANLSEARLADCSFENASLYNACFSQSVLTGCDFFDAMFGGTDIGFAAFEGCIFSGRSSLSLPWSECSSMRGTVYVTSLRQCPMTSPPLVFSGALAGSDIIRVALLDEDALVNQALYSMRNSVWLPDPATLAHAAAVPAHLHKILLQLQGLRPTPLRHGL